MAAAPPEDADLRPIEHIAISQDLSYPLIRFAELTPMPVKPLTFPGTYESFLAHLPDSLEAISEADLQSLYQQAQENAAIAHALETKRDELGTVWEHLMDELEAQGLTMDALLTFDRQERGIPAFHPGTPDYLLPPEWRR